MRKYQGSCHCGRITFELESTLDRAIECNCSICHRKGALWHAVGEAQLRMLSGVEDLTLYQFGTRTAKHYSCRYCGVSPLSRGRRPAPRKSRLHAVPLLRAGMKRIDYIVVGGGSAGCVIAARLTEDPGVNVLLLEAGDDERKFMRIPMPLAWRDAFRDPRTSWGFMTDPEPFADQRSVPAPRGKVLGGSNSVNGCMYMRGCPADYDEWAAQGLPGWGYQGVLPYFRRSENNWRGMSRYHSAGGPLTVARHETDDVIYPRVIDTAEALGFKHLEDFHGEDIEGFTAPDFNYHGGERGSTAAAFCGPPCRGPICRCA